MTECPARGNTRRAQVPQVDDNGLMIWAERVAAGLIALVCLAFLVRLLLPAPAQQRLDAAARQTWQNLVAQLKALRGLPKARRQHKTDQAQAEQLAREAIEKARRGVERDGNVLRPKAFKGRDHDAS